MVALYRTTVALPRMVAPFGLALTTIKDHLLHEKLYLVYHQKKKTKAGDLFSHACDSTSKGTAQKPCGTVTLWHRSGVDEDCGFMTVKSICTNIRYCSCH